MRENGIAPKVIRAGRANLFLSDVFAQAFVDLTGVPLELYDNNGSVGAALGAGIGSGIYKNPAEAFSKHELISRIEPKQQNAYEELYTDWKEILDIAII